MKTLFPLSFIAALFAFLIFPVNFEIALSLLAVGGFTAIAIVDYSQARRPRLIPVRIAAIPSGKEKFGLAA